MSHFVSPGLHLLIDFWNARHVRDAAIIEQALREAASACGATVLEVKLHHFGEDAGITGVAILAESHISIHTWPETGYVAIDVFLCGARDPHKAIPVLKRCFEPEKVRVSEHRRGV